MAKSEKAGQGDGDAERSSPSRGAGFPVLDLSTAVELIHKVGEHGGEFSSSAFAQYLGHTTANSGPYRSKAAAFRDWGLAVAQGGRVYLTDLGKAVAKSSNPMMDEELLRNSFDSCEIFKAFYEDMAKGVVLKRDTLGRAAVFDHNVSAKSQDKFVSMLVDSAVTVGLAEADGESVTFKSRAATADGGPSEHEDPDPDSHSAPGVGDAAPHKQRQAPVSAEVAVPVLLRQVWPTATGEVVLAIHSTDPLPASAFEIVGAVVQAADKLATSIGLPAPAESVEPEGDDAA